jgi:hypothetical protein
VSTLKVGETWVVDGEWEFTVNSVTRHFICNSHDSQSGYIVMIDYTYKNIGYTNTVSGLSLHITRYQLDVYDEQGVAGDLSIGCPHEKSSKQCVEGTSCNASAAVVLTNYSSEITLVVELYTSNYSGKAKARFELPVN